MKALITGASSGIGRDMARVLSNDYGYEFSFSRQLEALGNKNDIFIAISTSGNSKNIINAIVIVSYRREKEKYVKSN